MKKAQDILLVQRDFFEKHHTLDEGFKRAALLRLKSSILKWQSDIEAALRIDLNKSPIEGYMTEINIVLSELEATLKHMHSLTKKHRKPTQLSAFPAKSYTVFEPYGVVLILSPWNYPFQLAMAPLIGAIAAGNCVILKTSSSSPATSAMIEKIIAEVFSAGYVSCTSGIEYDDLLAQRYDYIFFTGSGRVGKIVMTAAAAHLTPVSLELGGKSPCIVEKTADVRLAARRIVWGKLLNAGQTCVAPDYIIVHSSLKADLIDALVTEIKRQYGNALSNPNYPKIVSKQHFNRIKGLMEGEEVIGGEVDEVTQRIAPAILPNAGWESKAMQEEIFGPIFPILTYDNISTLISELRTREKPLACYLFTQNKAVRDSLLRLLPFGGGCVNDTVMHLTNHHLPFGGVGGSGMGSYHGKYSLETFSHEKAVFENRRLDLPLRYRPYSDKTERLLRLILKNI